MSRVVVDGQLRSVSASQINTFTSCRRKWFFEKVEHLVQPETEALKAGLHYHAVMEAFFIHGTVPTLLAPQAVLKLPDVPKRNELLIIEEPRNFNLGLQLAGVPVRGRIDLQVPPIDRLFRILDWKSKGTWGFFKTPEELARDPQGLIYLEHGFVKWPDSESGVFLHVYMQNKGGHRVKVVKTDPMGRGEVHDRYLLLEPIVSEMKQVASAANAEDVTPNWNACEKFGGCPYQSICPSVGRSVLTGMDEETMPESNEKRIPLSERMKAKAIVETVTKPGDVIPAATQALATGINPPDAAKPAPVTPWNPDAPVGPTPEPANQLDVPRSMTLAQAAENEALHLFVDCAPVRGDSLVKHLDAIIVQRTPEILAHCRKADPKCVPDGAVDVREVKFGQGVAALVASFAKHPPAGNVVAHSGALTNQILDVLQPVAARVIRAL